jgi:hypothetical protein
MFSDWVKVNKPVTDKNMLDVFEEDLITLKPQVYIDCLVSMSFLKKKQGV